MGEHLPKYKCKEEIGKILHFENNRLEDKKYSLRLINFATENAN